MKKFILLLIRFYQLFIASAIGPRCRFAPSCSEYTKQAIMDHGLFWGAYIAVCRIVRCHPFSKHHGYDPVPENLQKVSAWQYWHALKRKLMG